MGGDATTSSALEVEDLRDTGAVDEAAWIRRRLLEEVADAEEVAAPRTVDDLVVLSGELPLRPPGPPASLRAVATAAGLEVDRAADLVRLTGLRVDDLDELRWFESDVAWLRGVDAALSLFDEAAIRALLRRVGVAMAQLAHASASAFRVNVLAGDEASARSAVVGGGGRCGQCEEASVRRPSVRRPA